MANDWLTIEDTEQGKVLKGCSREAEGEIVIPDGVTAIGDQAFKNCKGLTAIVIPDGVTKIGSDTFENCI